MKSRGEGPRGRWPRSVTAAGVASLLVLAPLGAASAAEPSRHTRFEIKQPVLESDAPTSGRYTVRAALRPDADPAPSGASRFRMKATIGGDGVATACDTENGIFSDGFETPPPGAKP